MAQKECFWKLFSHTGISTGVFTSALLSKGLVVLLVPFHWLHQSFPSADSPFNSPNVNRKLQLETNLLNSFIFFRPDVFWVQWMKKKPSFICCVIYHFLEIANVGLFRLVRPFRVKEPSASALPEMNAMARVTWWDSGRTQPRPWWLVWNTNGKQKTQGEGKEWKVTL